VDVELTTKFTAEVKRAHLYRHSSICLHHVELKDFIKYRDTAEILRVTLCLLVHQIRCPAIDDFSFHLLMF
jgi:hypothetical protein